MKSVLPVVTAALTELYGLQVTGVRRLWSGTTAVHARAQTSSGPVFVKTYPRRSDWAYETLNIQLTQAYKDAGVPAAGPVATAAGELMATHDQVTMSVWQWVDGAPPAPFTHATAAAAGTALARLHLVLDGLDLPKLPVNCEYARTAPARQIRARFDRLHAQLTTMPDRRGHAAQAARRCQHLQGLDEVRAGLAPSTLARVHGDFTAPNLLFADGRVAAVIDPRVQFADRARELGRIAADPHTVATTRDWPQITQACVRAYLDAGGPLASAQAVSSIRLGLLHSLTSTYPLEESLTRKYPPRIRAQQDRFWADRCTTIDKILPVLPYLEESIADYAGMPRPTLPGPSELQSAGARR